MLGLIRAHRHMSGSVDQDICSLQERIVEQAHRELLQDGIVELLDISRHPDLLLDGR